MDTLKIIKNLKIMYRVAGHEWYIICDDNNMYNLKTGREIKQTMNGRSIGYWVDRKFHPLSTLRPMLRKHIPEYCPF